MSAGLGLQDAVAGGAALVALGWLARRAYRRRRAPGGCEDCPGCAPAAHRGEPAPSRGPDLIPLSALSRPPRKTP